MINIYFMRAKGFNIGNDVIYLATNFFLERAFGEHINVITFPATAKYAAHYKAGLNSRTVYEINQYSDGLIIGSGNLYENGELDVDLHALGTLEVPMMLFCLSRGKIFNRDLELVTRTDSMPDAIISALNRAAKWSLTRDKATQSYLESIGLQPVLGGCPTLFINEICKDIKIPLIHHDVPEVAISIRHPNLMSIPIRYQLRVTQDIQGIIRFLRAEGYKDIRILCHDHRDNSYASIFEAEGVPYLYTEDVYQFMSIIQNTELSISYRLHATLPRIAMNKPTINIGYDQRAMSLLDTVGLGKWDINMLIEDDVVTAVRDRFRRMKHLWEIKEQAQSIWNQLRDVISESFQQFADEIKKGRVLTK